MTRKDTVFFSVIYHLLYDGKPSFPKEISGREKKYPETNSYLVQVRNSAAQTKPHFLFLMDFGLLVTDSNGDAQE